MLPTRESQHVIDGSPYRIYEWNDATARHNLTCICLHGFTGLGSDFQPLADAGIFRHLIAADLPGHGSLGTNHRYPDAFSTDATNLIVERCIALCTIPRPVMLGYSMGARIAIRAMAIHQTLCRSLILVGASTGISDPAERHQRAHADAELAASISREGVTSFMRRWRRTPIIATQAAISERYRSQIQASRRLHHAEPLARALVAFGQGNLPCNLELARIHHPILTVVGDKDLKYKAIATAIEQRYLNASLTAIENAGHAAHLEKPDTFSACVNRFVTYLKPRLNTSKAGK